MLIKLLALSKLMSIKLFDNKSLITLQKSSWDFFTISSFKLTLSGKGSINFFDEVFISKLST